MHMQVLCLWGRPKGFWFLEKDVEDKIVRKTVESIDQQNSCLCHKKMVSEARICPICLAGKEQLRLIA